MKAEDHATVYIGSVFLSVTEVDRAAVYTHVGTTVLEGQEWKTQKSVMIVEQISQKEEQASKGQHNPQSEEDDWFVLLDHPPSEASPPPSGTPQQQICPPKPPITPSET